MRKSRLLFRDFRNCNFVRLLIFLETVTLAEYTKRHATFSKCLNSVEKVKAIVIPPAEATALGFQ